jgi:hypothetical protein
MRLTEVMKKPNLFIVGAARSGTTSLWQCLKEHPDVYMPKDERLKEPSFFSDDCGKRFDLAGYLSIFMPAGEGRKWLGEASVAYLTDPRSAGRIHDFNPSARVIIMLRNPADRAYSLYNWMAQEGYEYAASFAEALQLEETRVQQTEPQWSKPNYYWGYLYRRSGLYHDQVKKYLDLFKQNAMIVDFEDFSASPESSFREICSFLQIAPLPVPLQICNPSRAVRSAKVLFVLRKLNNHIIRRNKQGVPVNRISEEMKGAYLDAMERLAQVTHFTMYERFLGRMTLRRVANFLKQSPHPFPYREIQSKAERDRILILGLKKGVPPPLRKRTRRELLEYYEPDVQKLSRLTGRDFSAWLKRRPSR